MPKNRKRSNRRQQSSTEVSTVAPTTTESNEEAISTTLTPIEDTPSNAATDAVEVHETSQPQSDGPKPSSDAQKTVASNTSSKSPSVVSKCPWNSPIINTNEPSACRIITPVVTSSTTPKSNTAKSSWGPRSTETTPQTTVSKPPVLSSAAIQPIPSNPSTASSRPERAFSVCPMTDETRRNLTATSRSGGNKEQRAQSAVSTSARRILRSAVPDSAILFPVPRPDDGGSQGKQVTVYANHFPVEIPDRTVNQYDIEISMLTNDGKKRSVGKDERWEIMQRLSREVENFPMVWYDEGKTLYSLELLPDMTEPIQIQIQRNDVVKTVQLEIHNLVRQEKLSNIREFVQKISRTRPRESVRIIETLMKQTPRNDLVAVRNQFYNRNQILEDLKDGRGMAKGFYQALFLTRCGPTLNVNLTFASFYMPLNFVEFAHKYLRKNIEKDGLSSREAQIFEQIIKDLLIETSHTGRPIRYKFRSFGLPANQLNFSRTVANKNSPEAPTTEEVSVAQYFAEKYQMQLKYPDLPCIEGRHVLNANAHWLPMEIATVVNWQRAIKPLDAAQRANVSNKSIIAPAERYDRIMEIMHGRNFDGDPYLSNLGISVRRDEMIAIKARVLDPPVIHYRGNRSQKDVIETVNVGKWKIRNFFYRTAEIQKWGLIYIGNQPNAEQRSMIENFVLEFPEQLRRKGLIIGANLAVTYKTTNLKEVRESLIAAHRNGWQLAIIILNTSVPEVYPFIKKMGNQALGLKTQCIDMNTIQKNVNNLWMLVDNISQKINAKLDGINSVVDTKSALKCSSRDDIFMFFGADVTHSTCSTDRPSIAAVVGSRDPTNTLYAARLSEQYPKKGRCSVEIIKDLHIMVADLLRVFTRNFAGRPPTKIVFYRDGVDEGHYQKVLDNEVNQVLDACRSVYRNQALPQITFIIVKKRHNTRFFLYENGRTLNVNAGTVIDRDITHPSQFDFYLCSQAAIKGTSRPTLYHVLHDDIKFSSDDIQQLTYWLCHTDMRCTKSVSIPAPVHYAHLAAYQARNLDFQDGRNNSAFDDDADDDGEGEIENYSIEDIQTKLMILDPTIVDTMWYL